MGPSKSPSVHGDLTNRTQSDRLPVHSQGLCWAPGAGPECHLPVESLWRGFVVARPLESCPEAYQFYRHLHFLTKKAGGGSFSI